MWYGAIRPTISDYEGEYGFESVYFATNTNPYFPKGKFESARKSTPQARFNEEYLEIPGENQVDPFGTDHINRGIRKHLSGEEIVVYGINLAKYNDSTVIVELDANGNISYFDRFQLPSLMTQERIEATASELSKSGGCNRCR